jgi:uncharacterized protein YegL
MSRAMCVLSALLSLTAVVVGQGQQAQLIALQEARLRSPLANERIAALTQLKQYPQIEAVRPVLLTWNKDTDRDVRMVAAGVLFGWRSDMKLRKTFLDTVKKDPSDGNAILAAVYLAGSKTEDHHDVLDALARIYEKRLAAVQALMPVADFLGMRDDPDAVKALTAFTKLAAYQKHFGFRRSVVQALIGMQRRDAVATLVDVMGESDGEIQGDIAVYFTRISNQGFGLDAKAWKSWWLGRQNDFEFPDVAKQKGRQIVGVPLYYNIPVFAKKVIFVIDTSGSMAGPKLTNAKAELRKTIEALPPTTQFNVVAFNSTLIPWQKSMQTANTDMKNKAVAWANGQKAQGATHTYDALRIALDQQPEAMYVLTDGEPTGGTIVTPPEILEAIKQSNKYRRTTVHAIGLSPGPENGMFSQFLKELAAQNYGQYHRVD